MKILNICDSDPAGVAFRMTECVREYTDHEARHIRLVPHKLKYPYDMETRDPDRIQRWVEWADVVTIHDKFGPLRQRRTERLQPPNLIVMCHGGVYGETVEECARKDAEYHVKRRLCTNAHVVALGAEWLPIPTPIPKYAALRCKLPGKPIVCQAPTSERKNITEVRAILGKRSDIRLRIIENTPHHQCLLAKAEATICIDRFDLGIGATSLESWAMGIPVISHAEPLAEKCILGEVGYLPYYDAPLDKLADAVEHLLTDAATYKEYAERGWKYVNELHDYPVVAARYAKICEEVLSEGLVSARSPSRLASTQSISLSGNGNGLEGSGPQDSHPQPGRADARSSCPEEKRHL